MKMNSSVLKKIQALLCLILLVVVSACKDDNDDVVPSGSTDDNQHVNNWILENMQLYYLWTDKLPASPDKTKSPDAFFESLLYTQEDRFSWIQENYQDLLNSLQGVNKEAGFEFVLYRDGSSENVLAQITYIKPASPASATQLKRGDVIDQINGQQITTANYQSLLAAMSESYTIAYRPLDVDNKKLLASQSLSLTPIEYKENPNYLNKVITIDDHKIGYFVYNFFATSSDGKSTAYDDEMESVFAGFKSAGITDLVLDLRYNSGGSETSANNLASLIGGGIDNSKVFLKREYNATIKAEILKDDGEAALTSYFKTKSANVGGQLRNNRVYILTSSRTASASELIINALKPYMDVYLIGDTTYGKNVGSISIYDDEDPKNTWGMQPIIVKVYNTLNQSDYTHGFTPNIANKDNSIQLYPLGDIKENLLNQALLTITGNSSIGRQAAPSDEQELIGFSLDNKRSSFTLIVSPAVYPNP